jgi:multiple sugar transport system permease protein
MNDRTFFKEKEVSPAWFVLPSLIILFAIIAYPLGYSLYISFQSFNIAKPYMGRFFVGVNNYVEALKDPYVIESLRLTFVLSFVVVAIEFGIGLGVALLFNRRSRAAYVIQTLFLIPFAVTPVAIALLWRYIFEPDIGIANYLLRQIGLPPSQWHTGRFTALLSIALVCSWRWIPFSVIVLLAGLHSIPRTPYEAGKIDGANSLQILWYITLPLLKPLILFLILIRLLYSLKLFEPIHVLTQGGPGFSTEIFNYHLYKIVFRHYDIGYGAAISFLMFGISILLCVFLIRFLPEEGRE